MHTSTFALYNEGFSMYTLQARDPQALPPPSLLLRREASEPPYIDICFGFGGKTEGFLLLLILILCQLSFETLHTIFVVELLLRKREDVWAISHQSWCLRLWSSWPTFVRICRRKSTEGFQSVPYVVSLFSAILWIYYALVKGRNATFLITINAFGSIIESIYIIIYLIYAPRRAKINTVILFLLLKGGIFGLIVLVINLVVKTHSERVVILGWFCVSVSVSVFVAPLSIIRRVISTRSVEFMPFYLSFFLTLSAIFWFFHGFLSHDKFVAIPNVLGFLFGSIQMVLYAVYKNRNENNGNDGSHEQCEPEHIITMARLAAEVHPMATNEANMENAGDKENIGV